MYETSGLLYFKANEDGKFGGERGWGLVSIEDNAM